MNNTSANCYRPSMEFPFLNRRQLDVLTTINSVVMVVNLTSNMLVIYVLIKTEQLANNACKLIFMLSVSDFMIGLLAQNLQTAILYEKICSLMDTYAFIATFFVHLSMYTIATMGIDRYLRIKHYANFKAIWTTRVVSTVLSIDVFLSLLQSIMTLLGLLSAKEYMLIPVYLAIDCAIIIGIIFLQILTIRTSSALCNESRISASEVTNKKITKLSLQIMVLFCCFNAPHFIIYFLREIIQDELNDHGKSWVDFVAVIASIVLYANSSVNAILFLVSNVKAKRFLRNFGR